MARENDVVYQCREFLCPEGEVNSYIDAHVTVESDEYIDPDEKGKTVLRKSISATLTLADCHRSVDWDFGIYTYGSSPKSLAADKAKVRAKMRKARRIINGFFDALEEALKEI